LVDATVIVRRTQQQRRERTQERVLDAAIELILERGYANIRTADIAERAGVSRGAQTHYYPTKQLLAVAAARRAMASAVEDMRLRADAAPLSADVLSVFLEQSERFFFETSYVAMIDILMAARTDSKIQESFCALINETRSAFESIWIDAFIAAGLTRANGMRVLALTHNVLRGLAISAMWESSSFDRKPLIVEWSRVVRLAFS
jgi:AcrR family transcriptional regulator